MKIILALDSFKDSLTAHEVTKTVSITISRLIPNCEIIEIPISDGGEGFSSILHHHFHSKQYSCIVHNPLGELINANYSITRDHTAIIEMANAAGISLLSLSQRNPLYTSTYGVGEMLRSALERHCKKIILGIGGSATNDGGMGMLSSLGVRFLDSNEQTLDPIGKNLHLIKSIDTSSMIDFSDIKLTVACDVQNPLFGENGAAYVFAPQKGAKAQDVILLDQGLQNYAEIMHKTFGRQFAFSAGAGAAGGLGFALMHLGAEIISGAELVLDTYHFNEILQNADLVITGEGKMDKQTIMGKAPATVLRYALQADVPVIGITGIAEDISILKQSGFKEIIPIVPPQCELKEAVKPEIAKENIRKTVSMICSKIITKY